VARALDLLADFALDVWLVAKYAPQFGELLLDGRTWERTVAGLLRRPGFTRRQGPGSVTLFGMPAASGVNHEIDGAADNRCGSFVVECKATGAGITKADAALFHFKVMDFYQKRIATASHERWWRFLCGTVPTPQSARAVAVSLGMLICDPSRVPLPVLVRAAGRPAADMHLPEALLQEVVRLGERALCPQQEQWPYRAHTGEISFRPDHWSAADLADLLWLEDELSGYLLDLFEKRRPGVLETRANELIWRAKKTA
jgi:hypothetical protein